MEIKKVLFDYCVDYVEDSILFLEKEMNSMQKAANTEIKGSAGDKHETGRAMMHIEKEKVAKQLADRLNLRKTIAQLDLKKEHSSASLGSLINTDNGIYYLSIPIGKVEIENEIYFIVSSVSPIGRILLNCKKGDSLEFNGNTLNVIDIY